MKKFTTLMTGLMITSSMMASTKMLFNHDFENPEQLSQWSYGGENLSLVSDEFGNFLQFFQGQQNGRSGECTWGTGIYGADFSAIEDGKYHVAFDFNCVNNANNQYNSGITLMSNCRTTANQPFNGRWTNAPVYPAKAEGYLFDLTQLKRETEEVTSIQWFINGDSTNVITMPQNTWYTITCDVTVADRTVEWGIYEYGNDMPALSGTRTIPTTDFDGTEISMYAEGLWVMVARYATKFQFDNVIVTCESEQDVANDPSVALTGLGVDADGNLNLNLRTYTITFLPGETLNITGTDGAKIEASYDDCNGAYKYTTTTSGTLKAWTVSGVASSNVIEAEVDCSPCVLPEVAASIISVSEGYGKTYKMTVDNSTTPLSPTIFISYEFTPADGGEKLTAAELGTGATVTLPSKGTLVITSSAFGYQSATTTIVNDQQFTLASKHDFVHVSGAEIEAKGFEFEKDLNSSATSGEGNWTARKGMFYYDAATATVNEEGATVYTAVYPFGFVAEEDTEHVIHCYKMLSSKLAEAHATVFPGLDMWQDFNMQWKQGIGIIVNTMKKGDAEDGDGMAKAGTVPVKVCNLKPTDFVLVKKISNYGRDMQHPVINSAEEYDLYDLANISEVYAAQEETVTDGEVVTGTGVYSVSFDLYRIDTALAAVEVYSNADPSGIENIKAENVVRTAKMMVNGQLLIVKGSKTFNAAGMQVK